MNTFDSEPGHEMAEANETIERIISTVRQRTESEQARSGQDWLSCFINCCFQLNTYLDIRRIQALFSEEQRLHLAEKTKWLSERVKELRTEYGEGEVPDEIKEELYTSYEQIRT